MPHCHNICGGQQRNLGPWVLQLLLLSWKQGLTKDNTDQRVACHTGGRVFRVSCCPLVALQVKPTLQRLKGTLLGSGTALVLTAGVLFGLVTSGADADGMYGTSPLLLA